MNRRLFRNFSFVALLVTASLSGVAGQASAAEVVNGNFETGSFLGWGVSSLTGTNRWTVADRQPIEEEFQFSFPAGTGAHVAVTEYNGADTDLLSQEIALPAASNIALSLYLFYESAAPIAVPSPNSLFVSAKPEGSSVPENQQVRVDVLKANAPLESVSPNDILATPYASQSGDPEKVGPKLVTADLSAEPLAALIPGKFVRNRGAGSGMLSVTLPGPGTLTVSDARRQVAVGSAWASLAAKAAPKPILIRTATAQAAGPQTVRVPIRPTAAAQKLLRRNGKLRFHLQLTFAPASGTATSGTVSAGSYKGILLKRLRPVRR